MLSIAFGWLLWILDFWWGLAAFRLFFWRLTAQFGAAVQPMRFEYEEANRMTALHSWCVPQQEMSLSPVVKISAASKFCLIFEGNQIE